MAHQADVHVIFPSLCIISISIAIDFHYDEIVFTTKTRSGDERVFINHILMWLVFQSIIISYVIHALTSRRFFFNAIEDSNVGQKIV